MTHPTQMRREIAHIPEAVADLLARGGPDVRRAADALRLTLDLARHPALPSCPRAYPPAHPR